MIEPTAAANSSKASELWRFTTVSDAVYVRTVEDLAPSPASLGERLRHWAAVAPERVFLARRASKGGAWLKVTYAEALDAARAIGSALEGRHLSPERPVVILAGNGLEHGLLALGCLYAGIPWAPVSPSYSQSQGDLSKLRHVLKLLTPGLIFVDRTSEFARALDVAQDVSADVEVVAIAIDDSRAATPFDALTAASPGHGIDAAQAAIGADAIAKFLLTSGSTGMPKAVIQTHGMLSANQQMIRQSTPCLTERPPVLVDWLPWNHTFGGNKIFGIALYNGGTLYIDDGKPAPGKIEETVANLKAISPTLYFNVPVGFELLLSRLEEDTDLRRSLFADLDMMYYAGAGLRRDAIVRLEDLARQETGRSIPMLSGLGATETGPYSLLLSHEMKPHSDVGLPCVGVELKLKRMGDKAEARLRGRNITPGYWRAPQLTADAFDDEGFYRLGDALTFVDPAEPWRGLVFDGRIAEDFKLSSGTWVSAGPLRSRLLAALKPLAWDIVVAGLNRSDVRLLIFPDFAALRAHVGAETADLSDNDLIGHPTVRTAIAEALARVGSDAGGAGRAVAALMMTTPPSLDAGELTDKGSISQRGVLKAREADVERLYAATPSPDIVMAAHTPSSRGNAA